MSDSPEAGTADAVDDTGLVGVSRASEWMVSAGAATSVELFHSQDGIRYAVQTLSWARELTTERGPALLRGRLAWTVELMPVLAESSPTHVYGVGVAPIGLRWNLQPRPRWSAFTELGGGFLGSSAPIPTGVARFNFMAHWGAGVRLPVSSTQAVVIGYRFHHISNGDRLPLNPGVNSHIALVGWSLTRQH